VKNDGFSLISKDGICGDAWILAFNEAEIKLIDGANRKVVLSVLKALRELHLDVDVINSNHLCNLLLSECEKHPNEEEWAPEVIGDRIVGILLQVTILHLENNNFPG